HPGSRPSMAAGGARHSALGLKEIMINMPWVASAWMRRASIACFVALVLTASSFAVSQIVGSSVLPKPPERLTLDQNNVDVTTGSVSLSSPQLSIGQKGQGLELVAYMNPTSGWRDSFSGALERTTFGEFN